MAPRSCAATNWPSIRARPVPPIASTRTAWAEVYLPGGGWRGYDPSYGLAVSLEHVAVAAAAYPALAAPLSGTYRGNSAARLEVQISMRAEEQPDFAQRQEMA
jgi:transglutaminase-like putative cysteine protease